MRHKGKYFLHLFSECESEDGASATVTTGGRGEVSTSTGGAWGVWEGCGACGCVGAEDEGWVTALGKGGKASASKSNWVDELRSEGRFVDTGAWATSSSFFLRLRCLIKIISNWWHPYNYTQQIQLEYNDSLILPINFNLRMPKISF